MTTFARLAKIVSGEIEPKNWIERAFKALATAAGGKELPDVGTDDKGKYLHTNDSTGALEWSAIEDELPAFTRDDEGKFLGVVEGASAPEVAWGNVRQVPAVEVADKGKFLHANDSTGALEWSAAGGGDAKYINLSISGTAQDPTYTADKTFNEIAAIYASGSIMAVKVAGLMPNTVMCVPLSGYLPNDEAYVFSGPTFKIDGHLLVIQVGVSSLGWSISNAEIDT